ncbi:MAG: type II toxin-antitoxin system RelE/ParE family toxin [bacterium]
MKVVKFHPDAESEMIAAAAYYEEQQPDLGRRFLASVQDAINRIILNPRLYARRQGWAVIDTVRDDESCG